MIPRTLPANLPTELVIEVTQHDIATGVAHATNNCPVARALHRMGYNDVSVMDDEVMIEESGMLAFYHNDTELSDFVHRFDGALPVQPQTIVIRQLEP